MNRWLSKRDESAFVSSYESVEITQKQGGLPRYLKRNILVAKFQELLIVGVTSEPHNDSQNT